MCSVLDSSCYAVDTCKPKCQALLCVLSFGPLIFSKTTAPRRRSAPREVTRGTLNRNTHDTPASRKRGGGKPSPAIELHPTLSPPRETLFPQNLKFAQDTTLQELGPPSTYSLEIEVLEGELHGLLRC
jgi:hypothetical protein